MPSPALTRRALLTSAGATVASAAVAVPYVNAAHADDQPKSLAQRIEHHIAGLHAALAEMEDLGAGPVRIIVGSDHGAVVERLTGSPFGRGVPPTLWRIA